MLSNFKNKQQRTVSLNSKFTGSSKKSVLENRVHLAEIAVFNRGGVEDTRLKAKNTKKIRGQGQTFRGQTLSRPRTGMLEAKNQGHSCKCSPKKRSSKKFFRQSPIHRRSQNFYWGEAKPQIICNDVIKIFQKKKFL